MPVYADMKTWLVDRQKAKVRLEQEEKDGTQASVMAQEKYIGWLDREKPEWLNDVEQPEAKP